MTARMNFSQVSRFSERWLDWMWGLALFAAIIFAGRVFNIHTLCAQMGADFRGYYALAQSIRQGGFSAANDIQAQHELQACLLYRCPVGTIQEPLPVTVPYLPVFWLALLPLPWLGFSPSYLTWSLVKLVVLVLYLVYFTRSLGGGVKILRVVQLLVCLPLIADLYLGQINIWLVVSLGEFSRAWLRRQRLRGGLWLAMLLIKPHMLILLLPWLLLSQGWMTLLGFLVGLTAVVGVSFLLAGLPGMVGFGAILGEFASPAFSTAPRMMNWRALAYNLQVIFPPEAAWGIALAGVALTLAGLWYTWRRSAGAAGIHTPQEMCYGIIAIYTATCAIAWHAHFYLWVALLPFLLLLDGLNKLPALMRALWIFGPPGLYLAAVIIFPAQARNLFGVGMLGFNLVWLAWAARRTIFDPSSSVA